MNYLLLWYFKIWSKETRVLITEAHIKHRKYGNVKNPHLCVCQWQTHTLYCQTLEAVKIISSDSLRFSELFEHIIHDSCNSWLFDRFSPLLISAVNTLGDTTNLWVVLIYFLSHSIYSVHEKCGHYATQPQSLNLFHINMGHMINPPANAYKQENPCFKDKACSIYTAGETSSFNNMCDSWCYRTSLDPCWKKTPPTCMETILVYVDSYWFGAGMAGGSA